MGIKYKSRSHVHTDCGSFLWKKIMITANIKLIKSRCPNINSNIVRIFSNITPITIPFPQHANLSCQPAFLPIFPPTLSSMPIYYILFPIFLQCKYFNCYPFPCFPRGFMGTIWDSMGFQKFLLSIPQIDATINFNTVYVNTKAGGTLWVHYLLYY